MACAWLVLLVTLHPSLCSSACRQTCCARHHGWFCGSGRARRQRQLQGFAGLKHNAVFPSVGRPAMPGIMVPTVQTVQKLVKFHGSGAALGYGC